MNELLEAKNVSSLLLGIIIMMGFHLIKGVVEFLWKIKKKDDAAKEKTLVEIEKSLQRLNKSVNNAFFAIKVLAGPKWDEISKDIQAKNTLDT